MTQPAPASAWHDRVVEELRRQGRTKNWLHQRSKVARSTIDDWASQPKPPQARTVIAVARALGVDDDEALALAGLGVGAIPGDAVLNPARLDTAELVAGITTLAEELRRRADR